MEYKKFIDEHRQWIRPALTWLIVAIFAGLAAAIYFPEMMESIISSFEEEFGENPALDFGLAQSIFIQNLTVSVIAWIGGLALGIIPVLVILVNGFILGYVVSFVTLYSDNTAQGLGFLALGLVPHGVIEIPAFIVAAVLGMRLGLSWVGQGASGQRLSVLKTSIIQTAKYFAFVVLALAMAAIIEVFVSGKLVENF